MRYLAGLNRQDWHQELQGLGADVAIGNQIADSPVPYCGLRFHQPSNDFVSLLRAFRKNTCFVVEGNEHVLLILPQFELETFVAFVQEKQPDGSLTAELQQLLNNLNKNQWQYRSGNREIPIEAPLWMGVLNVTPDSFSDGGKFLSVDAAVQRAHQLVREGAQWLDIGGESTRPGAERVSAEEEWQRIGPVIDAIVREYPDVIISVDTYKSEVARRALEAGAHIINDISALSFDPRMAEVVAHFGVPVVLMHIQGTPRDMQKNPHYTNLMDELIAFLDRQIAFALKYGITQIIVDPGIGFGKRWEDNFEILRRLQEFRVWGYPVLLGVSRKSFIGKLVNEPNPEHRLGGTIGANLVGWQHGATIFRVHDVAAHMQAFSVTANTKILKANFRNN